MLFTEQEIVLMQKNGIGIDFNHLEKVTDDEWCDIIDIIADRLVVYELDENYEPTPDGLICEDILEKLARMD